MKLLIVIILIFAFAFAFSQEKDTKAPKYSNEFLSVGIGARASGMGNSIIASVADVTSGYWNPAGLTLNNHDLQLGAMHNEYYAGIGKYDFLGAVKQLSDSSAFGISIIRFGVDDIPNTLDLIDSEGNIDYSKIKSFSVADYAFMFSYARKLPIKGLRVGGNVKIIRRNVGEFANAWGFGLDAAAQYDYNSWKFALMARDITTTFNAWTFHTETFEEQFLLTGNEVPVNSLEITLPKFIFGAAKYFKLSEKFDLIAEVNFDVTTDGKRNVIIKSDPFSIDPHAGVEVGFMKIAYLRAGVMNLQKIPNINGGDDFTFQPNIGLGLHLFNRLTVDYSFTDIADQSIALYSHVFSLCYAIDKTK
ncbi:MAG: PorV/PorQ family protein [Marinilabiliales bacterium]